MKISELVDIDGFRELCESFTALTGLVTAILDLEGSILIATGWQEICTRFHRVHPLTARRCRESDTILAGLIEEKNLYTIYKCKNGLIDVSARITIGGEHIGNFFTGQFFLEAPDVNFFIHQAEEFGFDKVAYLDALSRVPIIDENYLRTMMRFFCRLSHLIGEMGYSKKRLEEVNIELHMHRSLLEEQVKKRTFELTVSNKMLQAEITERKLVEEKLQKSRKQLANIIDFLPDATLVIDKEGKVIAWNRAMEAMTGVKKEDMLGKGNYEYTLPFYGIRRPALIDFTLHPNREMEKRYTAIQRMGDVLFGESFTPNLPSGSVHVSATASVLRDEKNEIIAAIECIRNDTERKRLEERLNRAEKMESLGTLAGGVAHDLNNVLGVLVGYSELLADELPVDSLQSRYADNILKSSIKGTAIIQDLLTLARRGVTVSEVIDLNKLVSDYLQTPEFEKLKSYHPDVIISIELEDDILNIKGSPIHLAKTIMNLVSNGTEAISGRGKVTIKTANHYLDRAVRGYDTMQEGDYALLIVSDTGIGISANDLSKIFEPFYTKKVMGRSGTGLGLAVVWGTVKDHNGYIDVQSEEGKGTTFTLYFPVTREERRNAEKAVSSVTYIGKGESILVVDDVKEQRELAMNMLERLGYRVEAVAGGQETIEYLKNKKADLIVLDMIMDPGIDGMETYRRILEINPEQKAIIVSGFSETDRVRNVQKMGAGDFVRKPYVLEKIGLAVRKELDTK